MIKLLKRIVLFLFIIAIVIVSIIYFKAETIKEALLHEVKVAASTGLKGDFSIEDIGISMFPVSFSLKKIHTKNDSFDLSIKNIDLGVQVSKLLFGEVVVTAVKLSEPQFSTQNSHEDAHTSPTSHDEGPKASLNTHEQVNASLPFTLSLEKVSLSNGSVFISGERPITINNISLSSKATLVHSLFSASDVEVNGQLMKSVPFSLSLPRIDFDLGSQKLTLTQSQAILPGAEISMNAHYELSGNGSANISSKKFSLEALVSELKKMLPSLVDFSISGNVTFNSESQIKNKNELLSKSTISLSDISFTHKDINVKEMKGDVALDVSPQTKLLQILSSSFLLGNEEITLSSDITTNDKIRVHNTKISCFGGSLSGSLVYAPETSAITSSHTISSINISRALSSIHKPLPIKGTLASFTTKEFSLTPRLSSFSGSGNVAFGEITIEKINILSDVFKALQSIPGVSESIRSKLSPLGIQALSSSDTALNSLTGSFIGAGDKINVENLSAQSPLFTISGSGFFTPKTQTGGFSLTLGLSKEVSNAVKSSNPALSKIRSETISIPLTISLNQGGATVLPNVEKLIETLGKEALKDVAQEALSQALSSKSGGKTKDLVKGLLGF